MAETRQFKMHAKLLFDVIQRQAGTLGKAVLEGVMNAIDAKATEIEIKATQETIEITDNGTGFKNKEEIELFFETFGQPHSEAENKRFGTFRMGRGQLFAFGRNCWRTGSFLMDVDIKATGLDYHLHDALERFKGCHIVISLYEPLKLVDLRSLEDDLKEAVKWAGVPVLFNSHCISRDPAEADWTHEDEHAYYAFRDVGSLTIYNLGVRVHDRALMSFGVGGEVVSKRQLKLNFARNDVMSDCPAWKRIKTVIDANSSKRVKKESLSAGQRHHKISQLRHGELSYEEMRELPLFTDVRGKHWSFCRLQRDLYNYQQRITVAPAGDGRGDRLMEQKTAFCFADTCLQAFHAETLEDLMGIMQESLPDYMTLEWKIVDYRALIKDMDDRFESLSEADWSPTETVVLRAICHAQNELCRHMTESRTPRQILLGVSDSADAWTDGVASIHLTRKFLRKVGVDAGGWAAIGQALLHEYCHGEADSATHSHSPDFFELYHNSHAAVPAFVRRVMSSYASGLKSTDRRLTRQQLRDQDKENERRQNEEKILAKTAEPEKKVRAKA